MIKIEIFIGDEEMIRPKIGLALGSGAAKGFAHIGVLKALEENNIQIDIISGCSAGALIGGLYCSGINAYGLEKLATSIKTKDWVDLTIPKRGVIKGNKIEDMIKELTNDKNIEDLDKEFISVATNLRDSKKHLFTKGSLYQAIRSSISVPGIFEPVEIDSMLLVDGAVLDRVPVSVLKKEDLDFIIAVNLGFTDLDEENTNIFDIIIQSVELLTDQAMKPKELDAELVIQPNLRCIGPTRFDLAGKSIAIGYDATMERISDIYKMIEKYNNI